MTMKRKVLLVTLCVLTALVTTVFPPASQPVLAAPQLWLPTPVNESWGILQGFYCGSHVGSQTRSLDFVNLNGATRGAPVRAAAPGTTFVWQGSTGTLILSHGGGYYTMYTHLQNPITTRRGLRVRQGQIIGQVGVAGTTVPHLHFLYFYAPDRGAYQRTPLELNFADGYAFHDTAGCNQHLGEVVVAQDNPDETPPTVTFAADIQPDQWYCEDTRIPFEVTDNQWVGGFSQSFDTEPASDKPDFEAETGYVQLSWAGEGLHTLYVRAWDDSGHQTLATLGPIGYDATAPELAVPDNPPENTYRTDRLNNTVSISWDAASDGDGSGVSGYHYYLGTDPQGTSDAFTDYAGVTLKQQPPGCYLLRVQALDYACGKSEWATVQQVVITDRMGQVIDSTCPSLEAQSEPADEPTPEPADEVVPNPTATATPNPTATPEPVNEVVPDPTATTTPDPTATATPDPTATPEPVNEVVPEPTATEEIITAENAKWPSFP